MWMIFKAMVKMRLRGGRERGKQRRKKTEREGGESIAVG